LIALDAINGERGLGLDGVGITADQWDASYAEAYRRVGETLLAGHSLIYDETCFLRAQRDAVRAIAARAGVRCRLIWVVTPEATVRARWLANRAAPARYDVRDGDFTHVVTHFEPPTSDERPLRYDGASPPEAWLARMGLIGGLWPGGAAAHDTMEPE
jgi:predicted kinase